MFKRHKFDIITILALICLGISLYLSITHYLSYTVPCNITHGCEVVLTSKYSMLLGLPLAVWGVAYFTAVIICSLLANRYPLWERLLTIVLSAGALGSLSFLSIQFFILKKICIYCLTVDTLNLLIFIFDLNLEYRPN